MRTAKSPRWVGIGLVNGTSVKKKNLAGGKGLQYHFRVKPLGIGASTLNNGFRCVAM